MGRGWHISLLDKTRTDRAQAPKGNLKMGKGSGKAALWLLIIPYIGLLWVPFYNYRDPVVLGFPFFYWYQLAWVPITAFVTWIAYRSVSHDD